jgi:GntR family transcriptional regulator
MLALEGLVTRLPRFGTKVTGNITVLPVDDLGPEYAAESATGQLVGIKLEELDLKLVPATPVLRERLDVDDKFVLLAEHLLHVDGSPLYVRVAYLPQGPDPVELIEQVRNVFRAPHTPRCPAPNLYGTEVARIQTTVEAVPCDPRTARLLGIAAGAPILLRERTIIGTDNRPHELSFTHLRGDRAALSVETVGSYSTSVVGSAEA